MKKIAIVLTILCASTLNGMDPTSLYELRRTEQKSEASNFQLYQLLSFAAKNDPDFYLPNELIHIIVTTTCHLTTKKFREFVHMLANKSGESTTEIARKFTTPVAKQYNQLAWGFMEAMVFKNLASGSKYINDDIIKLIEQGADVNATFSPDKDTPFNHPPLEIAINLSLSHSVKLLLTYGANPNFVEGSKLKTIDYVKNPEMQKLLEEAMNQYKKETL